MPSGDDWADDFAQQVEEAVALKAILGDAFELQPPPSLPADPDELYAALDLAREHGPPAGRLCFRARVDVALPHEEIDVQVGEDGSCRQSVKHLTPIALTLRLPSCYPSAGPPEAVVSAAWLSAGQAAQLEAELAAMAAAEQGCPVCYTLVSWLEASALPHLGIADVLTLPGDSRAEPGVGRQDGEQASYGAGSGSDAWEATSCSLLAADGSAPADALLPEELFRLLLRYNASRLRQAMLEGVWQCAICLEQVPGVRCVQGADCAHLFCGACMRAHCRTHLQEGRVDRLTCPEPGCKQPLIRDRLRSLLEPAEAQRWEEAELQATLLRMPDVVFCPRCNAANIEDADNSAMCSKCNFAFCSLCQSGYHPGTPCMSVETKLRLLRERMGGRRDARALLQLKRREEELLSLDSVLKSSKPCPVCTCAIEKTEGCNKMTCSYCGALFCWSCNRVVAGYEHFREGGCVLFDEAEIQRWNAQFGPIDMELQPRPDGDGGDRRPQRVRWRPCPQCGQGNAKRGNLNMMACHACDARYCYVCGKVLRKGEGGSHFRPTGCRQHSAD